MQILHCMRSRSFTPRGPIPHVKTTRQEWKPNPEVIIKHDELLPPEHGSLILENMFLTAIKTNRAQLANVKWQWDLTFRMSKRVPHHEHREKITRKHVFLYRTWCGNEQPDSIPTTPSSTKYDIRHNRKPNCNGDYRYWMPITVTVMFWFILALTAKHIRTRSGNARECVTEPIPGIYIYPLLCSVDSPAT